MLLTSDLAIGRDAAKTFPTTCGRKVPNPAKESKDEGEEHLSFCPSGRALFCARKGIGI